MNGKGTFARDCLTNSNYNIIHVVRFEWHCPNEFTPSHSGLKGKDGQMIHKDFQHKNTELKQGLVKTYTITQRGYVQNVNIKKTT